jgi:hypothetical protein
MRGLTGTCDEWADFAMRAEFKLKCFYFLLMRGFVERKFFAMRQPRGELRLATTKTNRLRRKCEQSRPA